MAGSMNILHIVLEDFSTAASPLFSRDARLAAEHPSSRSWASPSTPNLERLARRSVVFQRAYCQAPICNPSRTSFMTSRRPSVTRVFTNDHPLHGYLPSGIPTLVDFLRAAAPEASVACARGSKLFHIACDHDAMGLDADHVPLPDAASHSRWAAGESGPWRPEQGVMPPEVRAAAAFILDPPGAYSADQYRARVALARLLSYAAARRRFYLGVGLVETHAFEQRVCHSEIVPHDRRGPAREAPPSRGSEALPPLVTWPNFDFWRTRTDGEVRRAVGTYYGCAAHVDGTIGALVGALDALNLSRSTAVVVQGDHGYSLGR